MQHTPHLKKPEELIPVLLPKNRMRRPFPLRWGIAALALFALFAVATQLQFSRISNEKIYQARLDTFRSDERAYDTAVKAHEDCLEAIETRETYRGIFDGVAELFSQTADLPVELFPNSPEAFEYQRQLASAVNELITQPVEEGLPPRVESDCPQIPKNKPVKPVP